MWHDFLAGLPILFALYFIPLYIGCVTERILSGSWPSLKHGETHFLGWAGGAGVLLVVGLLVGITVELGQLIQARG